MTIDTTYALTFATKCVESENCKAVGCTSFDFEKVFAGKRRKIKVFFIRKVKRQTGTEVL
jgi:hypothetical protein